MFEVRERERCSRRLGRREERGDRKHILVHQEAPQPGDQGRHRRPSMMRSRRPGSDAANARLERERENEHGFLVGIPPSLSLLLSSLSLYRFCIPFSLSLSLSPVSRVASNGNFMPPFIIIPWLVNSVLTVRGARAQGDQRARDGAGGKRGGWNKHWQKEIHK